MAEEPSVVRNAEVSEIDVLARLWFDGWQDAHAAILPTQLRRLRTLESFRERLAAALPRIRVVGPKGAPAGFSMIKDDELYQLYVAASARGSGIAKALISEVETRLASDGLPLVWLACAIGNERAARFYEKCGWRRAGTVVCQLETKEGPFPLEVWRYEKPLTRA
ncbi:MAG: GNAT family N-acetyltransferase [Polyangiaceae bacterium]